MVNYVNSLSDLLSNGNHQYDYRYVQPDFILDFYADTSCKTDLDLSVWPSCSCCSHYCCEEENSAVPGRYRVISSPT